MPHDSVEVSCLGQPSLPFPVEIRDLIYENIPHEIELNADTLSDPHSALRTRSALRATSRSVRDEIDRTATRKKWRLLYTDVSSVIVTVFDPIYSDLLQTFDTVVLRLSIEDTAELFEYGHDTVEYWWTGEHSNGFFEELYSPDYVYRFSDGYPFTQSTSIHTLEVVLPVKESQQIAAGAIAADANVFVGRMKEEVQHTLSRCWAPEAKGLQHVRIVNDTDGTEMFHKEVDRSYELELAEYRRKQAEGEEQLQQRLREKQASVFEKFEGLRCAV